MVPRQQGFFLILSDAWYTDSLTYQRNLFAGSARRATIRPKSLATPWGAVLRAGSKMRCTVSKRKARCVPGQVGWSGWAGGCLAGCLAGCPPAPPTAWLPGCLRALWGHPGPLTLRQFSGECFEMFVESSVSAVLLPGGPRHRLSWP